MAQDGVAKNISEASIWLSHLAAQDGLEIS